MKKPDTDTQKYGKTGISVQFLWIPSHTKLLLHYKIDKLTKESTPKENVEYNFGMSASSMGNNIMREVNNET